MTDRVRPSFGRLLCELFVPWLELACLRADVRELVQVNTDLCAEVDRLGLALDGAQEREARLTAANDELRERLALFSKFDGDKDGKPGGSKRRAVRSSLTSLPDQDGSDRHD